jgi:hypothetical protein
LKVCLRFISKFNLLISVTIILVSSANNTRTILLFLFTILGKSLIYSKKSKGPSIEACGTPHLILSHFEELLLLKKYKSPGSDQIPAELIQAGGEILLSQIHKLINFVWNKEELPD